MKFFESELSTLNEVIFEKDSSIRRIKENINRKNIDDKSNELEVKYFFSSI
jgi:hypothetical protein